MNVCTRCTDAPSSLPEASKVVLKTISSAVAQVVSSQLSHSCAMPPSERLLAGHARHAVWLAVSARKLVTRTWSGSQKAVKETSPAVKPATGDGSAGSPARMPCGVSSSAVVAVVDAIGVE